VTLTPTLISTRTMSSARSTVHNDDIELDTLGFDPGRQPEPSPAGSIKSSTRSRRRSTYEAEEPEEGEGVSSLPPVDGGWRAYSYLAGAFVIEMFGALRARSYPSFLSTLWADLWWWMACRAVWALPFSFSPMLDCQYLSGITLVSSLKGLTMSTSLCLLQTTARRSGRTTTRPSCL
jgi:hypothetical protein